ncbi:MAG: tetratricopeptide repeat protein, partial [Muribaculaceae bacterium]|nr:tetratricopeptide repeat protein [Muribaculaceae bacterium]
MNKRFLNILSAAAAGGILLGGAASCSSSPEVQKKEDPTVRRERVAVERGNEHFAHGDYADALDEYNSALEANPLSKTARFNRALALSQLISDEERDQLLQPDSLQVKNTMRQQAIEAYSAFTGNPADTSWYTNSNYNLGNLYYADGKYFYDKDSIQNALAGDMAAMAGGSMQDYRKHAVSTLEESVAAYKRTLNLEPDRMEARENLRLAQILLEKLKDNNDGGGNDNQQQ